jgi:hypothetical protein
VAHRPLVGLATFAAERVSLAGEEDLFMRLASLTPETRGYLVLGAFFATVFGVAVGLITSPIYSVLGAAYGFSCAFAFRHIRRSPIYPTGPLGPFSAREAYRLLGVALSIWLAVGALAFVVWRVSR